tara:strand:+ start:286 stop:1041 length:756 start_codon:yes stop_codon:yes gene_type:complete
MEQRDKALFVVLLALTVGLVLNFCVLFVEPPNQSADQQCQTNSNSQCSTQQPERITFWQRTVDDPINLFTGVLALLTTALVVSGIWQGCLVIRTINLGRDEFNATHRPRIIILSLELVTTAVDDVRDEFDTAIDRERIEVLLRFVNAGDATARTKVIGSKITDNPSVGITFHEHETKRTELTSGEEGTHWIESNMLFNPHTGATERAVYCIGYISYEDAAGRARKTSFCWKLDTKSKTWVREENSPHEYAY